MYKLIAISISYWLVLICLSSCSLFIPKTTTPLVSDFYPAVNSIGSPSKLMVMLPGIGNSISDFEKLGFIDALQARHPEYAVVTVNTHIGYFKNKSITTRLKEDIIAPAQRAGYKKIWLMGTSLGGLGSLIYLTDYPEDIAGIITIAPFLGEDELISSLSKSVTLDSWEASYTGDNDIAKVLWRPLIKNQYFSKLPIVLLAGAEDKFADAHQLFAKSLKPENILIIPGKHRLKIWKQLWQSWLDGDTLL